MEKTKGINPIRLPIITRRQTSRPSTVVKQWGAGCGLQAFRGSVRKLTTLYSPRLTDSDVEKVFTLFDKWVRTQGKRQALLNAKSLFLCVLKYCSGHPAQSGLWTATHFDGFPKAISHLKAPIKEGDYHYIRAVLTLLSHYRALQVPGEPDFSSITAQGPDFNRSLGELISDCVSNFSPTLSLMELDLPTLGYSSKMGPNGPSILACIDDLAALKKDPVVLKHLWSYLNAVDRPAEDKKFGFTYTSTGQAVPIVPKIGPSVKESILTIFDSVRIPLNRGVSHSKLSVKRELGGKDRVFALSDYFTKMALKPLHDKVASILRNIPEDYTFDQDRAAIWIKDQQKQGLLLVSYDLTSATDRFPVDVQQMVVEKLFNDKGFGRLWRNLVSDRDFKYKKKKYRYRVGQPMGFYSSWAIFALTHHCLVKLAAKRAGIHNPKYALLGDDIILEYRLAPYYKHLLDGLNVQTSRDKSLWGSWVEFAKRIFVMGHEVTPLPTRLLRQIPRDPYLLGPLFEHWCREPLVSSRVEDQFRSLAILVTLRESQRDNFLNSCTPYAYWLLNKHKLEASLDGITTTTSESPLDLCPEGKQGKAWDSRRPRWEATPGFDTRFRYALKAYKVETLLQDIRRLQTRNQDYLVRFDRLFHSCVSTGLHPDHHPFRITLNLYKNNLQAFAQKLFECWNLAFPIEEGDKLNLPRPALPDLDALTRRSKIRQGRSEFLEFSKAWVYAQSWKFEEGDTIVINPEETNRTLSLGLKSGELLSIAGTISFLHSNVKTR